MNSLPSGVARQPRRASGRFAPVGFALFLACTVVTARAQSLSGTYSATERMTLAVTALGRTDTETLTGPSQNVTITHTGNTLSYTAFDPSSGLSGGRTLTLSGSSITGMSGPAVIFRPTPGFSTSQNTITSVTGTAVPGNINLTMRGRVVGVIDGVPFTMDVTSTATFSNPNLVISAPSISLAPQSRSVNAGSSVTLTVSAGGTAPLTYQWLRNGVAIPGATSASYTIASAQASDAANYSVVVTNGQGAVTSSAAVLTVVAGSPPLFFTQPTTQTVNVGATVTFTGAATSTPAISYQWRRNGVALAGATSTTLTRSNVAVTDAGAYELVATNTFGATVSTAAFLIVNTTVPSDSRLANLSVRSTAGSGERTLIAGFVIGGSGQKQVLLRGIGPGLAQFGLSGVLANPQLRVFGAGNAIVGENDDWGGSLTLSTLFARAGAFGLGTGSRDAALLLGAPAGSYSGHLLTIGASGTALIEAYDVDTGTPTARFINLSARNQVGTGEDVLIAGFAITGSTPKRVLIRGVGPTLAVFGVGGVLADPRVQVYSGSTLVADNDNWGGAATLSTAFNSVGAFALPAASLDAAVLLTLNPGSYTALVTGAANGTGVGLVEVYEVP